MGRKLTGKPVGPPEKPINWEMFEQLCSIQCTQSEMSSFLKVHPNTLSDRVKQNYGEDYSTVYKKYSESGRCSLRRNQFVLSKKNTAMAIWLGKQWLGQKDHDEKNNLPPNDSILSLLIGEVKTLKDKINASEPKANTEL